MAETEVSPAWLCKPESVSSCLVSLNWICSRTVQEDANGEPLLDNNGRFIPNTLTTIFMMRKEMGLGADYKELRNGEWEYVA
jgi:hypothetical protein